MKIYIQQKFNNKFQKKKQNLICHFFIKMTPLVKHIELDITVRFQNSSKNILNIFLEQIYQKLWILGVDSPESMPVFQSPVILVIAIRNKGLLMTMF